MTESRTVETLQKKGREIRRTIEDYEQKIAQAQADLAHLNAAIAIFQSGADREFTRPYLDIHGIFKRGEMIAICKSALAKGPLNTRDLSAAILKAKGLDAADKVLVKAISYRLIHALRIQARNGRIVGMGREKAAKVWRLPDEKTLV
jgi:cell division septum initiation protein DivIVA